MLSERLLFGTGPCDSDAAAHACLHCPVLFSVSACAFMALTNWIRYLCGAILFASCRIGIWSMPVRHWRRCTVWALIGLSSVRISAGIAGVCHAFADSERDAFAGCVYPFVMCLRASLNQALPRRVPLSGEAETVRRSAE